MKQRGTVYLVGAGPGDPKLITRRGEELLRRADCVVYDRLIGEEFLGMTKRGCRKIYVGKGPDEAGAGQGRIHQILVKQAKKNRIVVRLKGGDPTLFGRISEELEALSRAGIRFEIIPGVSSAWAAGAAAGIPLTDRRLSSSVAVVTGQEAAGKRPSVRWKDLARGADTLVILMGRANLPTILRRLKAASRPASTPIALVRWAWTPRQEVLISSIGRLEKNLSQRPDFGAPVVAIVGEVVRLSNVWRERPLENKRILVTRPASDSAALTGYLGRMGADCVHLPAIRIRPRPISGGEARELLWKLPQYHWLLFTSHHGVDTLMRLAARSHRRLAGLVRGKVCAIGPRTVQSVREAGLKADLLPEEFSLQGLRRAFRGIPVRNRWILIPRSNLGVRDELAQELRRQGAVVDEVVMYETVPVRLSAQRVRRALRGVDVATFTSVSTVRSFFAPLRKERPCELPGARFNGTAVAAIGPSTAQALKEAGVKKIFLPRGGWTVEGLVKAVLEAVRS